jgi:Zn-dependent protease with chaperone function
MLLVMALAPKGGFFGGIILLMLSVIPLIGLPVFIVSFSVISWWMKLDGTSIIVITLIVVVTNVLLTVSYFRK